MNTLLVFILGLVAWVPFSKSYFPFKLNGEEKVLKETIDWFNKTNYTNQKIYYLSPYLAHLLNIDSFDSEKVGELWGLYPTIEEWGIDAIPDSTIVIWDAHFGPNECKIPFEKIMTDPNFQLLNSFKPKEPFQVLGGYNYEVHVFMKLPKKKEFKLLSQKFYDFEEELDLLNVTTIGSTKSFSGNKSCELNSKIEYSATFKEKTLKIPYNTTLIKVSAKVLVEMEKPIEALIIMSIDNNPSESLLWESKEIKINQSIKEWQEVRCEFYLSKNFISETNDISIYFWNRSKENFSVDDLIIEFFGQD
jgi:hypothetical protein